MAAGAVQAAIFAAGAVIGGGIATVVVNKRRDAATLPPRPIPVPAQPVVQVSSAGTARFSEPPKDVTIVQQPLPPVLRNGNPGEYMKVLIITSLTELLPSKAPSPICWSEGPTLLRTTDVSATQHGYALDYPFSTCRAH